MIRWRRVSNFSNAHAAGRLGRARGAAAGRGVAGGGARGASCRAENERLTYPIVQVPLALTEQYGVPLLRNPTMWAGFALAFKMRRQPNVYVAFTGDGATSPGDFYEGLNLASIHKLPLVVIVENNQ